MPAEPVGTRLARNVALLWVTRGLALGLQLVSFAIIASHLGPSRFGLYAFALAMTELLRILANFGFETVVTRDLAQQPARERELVPALLYLRTVAGLAAYGLLALVLFGAGYGGEQREAALVAGTLLVLLSIESLIVVLQVRLAMGWVAVAEIARAIFILAGVVVLARASAGPVAFVWLYVAAAVLAALVPAVAALRRAELDWRPRPRLVTRLIRTAWPIGLAGLFIALYYRMDMALLARFKSSADVGQYGAAYRFLETFAVLPALAMTVVAPVLALSFTESREVLERRFGRAVHLVTVLVVPIAVVGALTAWRLLPLLPGFGDYEGAGVALSILAPAAAALFLATIGQGVLVAAHLERRLLRVAAWGFAVNLVLNVALIPPYSYVGAAAATAATEAAVLLLTAREVRLRLGMRWPMERFRQSVAAGAICAAALIPAYLLHPFLQLAIGLGVYAVAVIALGTLDRDDVAGLRPFAPRAQSPAQ
jgi:O-antigen/teichoic acid export membrane protein